MSNKPDQMPPGNTSTFIDRLRFCIHKVGHLSELAKLSGVTTRTLSNYLKGKTEPRLSVIKKIAKTCHVSESWLLSDTETLAQNDINQHYIYPKRLGTQPQFSESAQDYEGLAFSHTWINNLGMDHTKAVIHLVAGDSMEPTFRHGDFLLVDTSINYVTMEGIYLLSIAGFHVIKRVIVQNGQVILKNDNRVYADESLKLNELNTLCVTGRVRWHSRII